MLGLLGAGGVTQAAIVDFEPLTDLGLSPGDTYRYAFVTSTSRTAASDDIADYNQFVQAAADASGSLFTGSGITWNAIGSTVAVSAFDNIGGTFGEPVFRVDGQRIASDSTDLWDGVLDTPIFKTEAGLDSLEATVWTGTFADGSSNDFRELGDDGPATGEADSRFSIWVDSDLANATAFAFPLYGISGTLRVPQGEAPLPPTIALLGLGLLLAAVSRRRLRR
jgi:hypothetical protein